MENQIIPTSDAMTGVQQTGERNISVQNQSGGIVNINLINNSTNGGSDSEKMMAIQSFSTEYYQLIVTGEDDVFQSNMVTVSADRALNGYYAPPEIVERCSTLSDIGQQELKKFPAIICRENTAYNAQTDPYQMAMYSYVRKIKVMGRNIRIVFEPITPFFQYLMCDKKNAVFFDLNMDCAITDLNHSAWSVHKTNLFEAFEEAGIVVPMPVYGGIYGQDTI